MELKSRIEQIPIERVPMFVQVLIEHAYDLSGKKGSFITAVSATDYAEHLAEKLLLRIPDEEDRVSLIKAILDRCTNQGIQAFSTILNRIELSYGRLAAKGREHGEKVISLVSLEMLEAAFAEKMKKLMSLSASKWTGSGTNWTFSDDYSSYVSKENVLESIYEVATSPTFHTLSQDLKETMAAFVLWNKDEEVDADERVPLSQVRELLDIWENAKE